MYIYIYNFIYIHIYVTCRLRFDVLYKIYRTVTTQKRIVEDAEQLRGLERKGQNQMSS